MMSEEYKPEQNKFTETNQKTPEFQSGQNWKDETGSEFSDQEITTSKFGSTKKSHLNRSTIFLLVSCLLAVGGIFFFSTRYKPKAATAEELAVEARVDEALQKFIDKDEQAKTKQLFENSEKMVQAFYEYPAKQQVPVDELQKNPFSQYEGVKEDGVVENLDEKRLLKKLNEQLKELELQTVVKTDRGSRCLINGKIFRENEVVDDTFTIKQINKNSVTLTSHEHEFVLQL